ncbi:MAG: IS4 family transposase [Planctomycetes bacterium]|nr:IS4 family transposase [Planctomycetota bacterium]
MSDGIASELDGINLGDARLNVRAKIVLESLASDTEASINAASDGWSQTKAAYRFFDNEKVTPENLMEPHRAATVQRMQAESVVLVIQDTTELDYSAHNPAGVGCLTAEDRCGFYAHVSLAVTPDKLCLGVVGHEFYSRTPESLGKGKRRERRSLPIEEMESHRWLDGYDLACRLRKECPNTQIVSIADREADIFEIYVMAERELGRKTDYIIRGDGDRCTPERDLEAGPYTYRKMLDELRQSACRGRRTIDLVQTPNRAARQAEVEIRAQQVTIKPPHNRAQLGIRQQNAILVEEINGPQDDTDISWLLVTSLPIKTMEQILKVIDYYRARWAIETFFRTLKTGCQVEQIYLETGDRLHRAVAMYMIVGWRVQYLTLLNRTVPNAPSTAYFTESEWKAVWCVVTKKKLPKKVPRLGEIMTLLAQLGGHNNRSGDLAPGSECVWRGIRRLVDLALAWDAFGPDTRRDVGN